MDSLIDTFFIIKGESMLPLLKEGNIIEITNPRSLRLGDLVVFKFKKKNLIVHRIVKMDRNNIITKGDNRPLCDIPITHQDVIGKVIKVGVKRVNTPYYYFLNPLLAKFSLLSAKSSLKITQRSKIIPPLLHDLKIKLIGNKNLHIESTARFFLNLPYNLACRLFKLLIK